MNDLVYLSLGSGRHVDELRFSILSAARHLDDNGDWRIVLYTDRKEPFVGLPVETRMVDETTAAEWVGPHEYIWRAKIRLLTEALAAPEADSCVYVDGDTYFRRSPAALFRRVGPGRSLLHMREGRPPAPEVAALEKVLQVCRPVDLSGHAWRFGDDRASWNAGVVGLHTLDAHLTREVEHLTDQLLDHGFAEHSHTSEQLAFTVCLAQRTALRGCEDVVVHYWPSHLRAAFDPVLAAAWADSSGVPEERFQQLWEHRPRPPYKDRAKRAVKRLAWRTGLHV